MSRFLFVGGPEDGKYKDVSCDADGTPPPIMQFAELEPDYQLDLNAPIPCVIYKYRLQRLVIYDSYPAKVTVLRQYHYIEGEKPVNKPTAAADAISMCVECDALLDDSRNQMRHQGRLVDRCLACGSHGLCPLNSKGPHVEIRWPEDPEYDLEFADPPGPLPEGYRVGYCAECLQPFYQAAGDTSFWDLTWEEVGSLWAVVNGKDPVQLGPDDYMMEIIRHFWTDVDHSVGITGSGTLHIRLRGSQGARGEPMEGDLEFTVSDRRPFNGHGIIADLFRVLGFGHGEVQDLSLLLGRKVIATWDAEKKCVTGWANPA